MRIRCNRRGCAAARRHGRAARGGFRGHRRAAVRRVVPAADADGARPADREARARPPAIAGLKTNWVRFAGPSAINDGLISGQVHFAAIGAPSMITLWSRTKNNVGVRGVSAMTTYPLYLVTRNPDVKTLKDLSAKDKIAVPSVKISTQAIMLQMAAQDIFGEGRHGAFDDFTISLSHPDAVLALMNNTAGVNAHFGTSPFYEAGDEDPRRAAAHHQLRDPRRARDRRGDRGARPFPRREPEGLRGVPRRPEGGDRGDQQGQARRRAGVSHARQGHQELGRRHFGDHQRQGLRLYALAREGVQDRDLHGQDRLGEGHAGEAGRTCSSPRSTACREIDRCPVRFASAAARAFRATGSSRRSSSPRAASSTT